MVRVAVVVAGILAAGAAVSLVAAPRMFYRMAVERRPKPFLKKDPALAQATGRAGSGAPAWDSQAEWLEASGARRIGMLAEDGTRLSALYLEKPGARGLAVAVHGYSSRAQSMGGFARMYAEEHGMSVLMPDLRGHGESEGNYIGFGWHDRRDLVGWVRNIAQRDERYDTVVLHGVSMGAAAVILASGEPDLPDIVRLAVADCGYSSAWGILEYQLKRRYGLPAFPFLHATDALVRRRAGYSIRQADPLAAIARSRVPFLLIHGTDDEFVPFRMMAELRAACPRVAGALEVPGAKHGMSFWVDPKGYRAAISAAISGF